MSNWKINEIQDRNDCFALVVRNLQPRDFENMLAPLKLVTSAEKNDKNESKVYLVVGLNELTSESAERWYCAYQLGGVTCPAEVVDRIRGSYPKKPLSITYFYSPQPIFDNRADCMRYAALRDQYYGFDPDKGKGAISGEHDHTADQPTVLKCGVTCGGEGAVSVDYEEMYYEMESKCEDLLEMLMMIHKELVHKSKKGWQSTFHTGDEMRRLSMASTDTDVQVLDRTDFNPPANLNTPVLECLTGGS